VKVTLILTFWDKKFVEEGGILGVPRFQNEGEIQRYLDFVQFTVSHFRDRVEYYEIWNEPDNMNTIQGIKVDDYINLVRRTVPIIRHEYPEAKIVVGGTSFLLFPDVQEYFFTILKSDVMALVDGVAWHPFYGTSPQYDYHRQYYYDYPILVQRIKDTASANGFSGEYFADELTWRTEDTAFAPWPHVYSEKLVAKYLARGIIMHLGMDIAITQNGHWPERYGNVIQGLCTSMAGAKPIILPVTIQSEATNTRSYGFSFPNGENLLTVWNDSVAVDYDSGIPSILKIPGYAYWNATSIDILNSTEQELITSNENGDLIIRDFLLKDYPVLILLSK
jgi:hypothetical protein